MSIAVMHGAGRLKLLNITAENGLSSYPILPALQHTLKMMFVLL